ncbi:MAG: hypothetical protein ACKN9E_04760 [Microcystaceae cyanobacterium]
MSQKLTLELSDEIYQVLQHQAKALGLSVTDWIITKLGNSDNPEMSSLEQESLEGQNWEVFALNNLNECYGEDEPIYDLTHIKEKNPDYERR